MCLYADKIIKLQRLIEEYTNQNVMVAFSGGVDSSLLLKMTCDSAAKKGNKIYAVTVHTMLHSAGDIKIAEKVARELGAIHYILETDELLQAGIENNPIDRCYLCKKHLFKKMQNKAEELGVSIILEGTNADDLNSYRPGIKAIQELGIQSPLAQAGMTKQEIRQLAAVYHLSVANRPAVPCLATRFPYGDSLSYEKMRIVEKGENFLMTLGISNVRLRVHQDIARLEVDEKELQNILSHKKEIISYLKELGYLYITLDLEGFRSGSMDIGIERHV